MSIVTKLVQSYKRLSAKQLLLAGVFMLAFAASIGAGFAAKQTSSANSTVRECDANAIDNQPLNGGCGALSAAELIKDIKNNNPSDLKSIYADPLVGLTSDKYDEFIAKAVPGVVTREGKVKVNGEAVMEDVWTMGRLSNNKPGRLPITLSNGKTYYHAPPNISFASHVQELDVMVMFDENGTVEVVIMESCGNPIPKGKKIPSSLDCLGLNADKVDGQDNTYKFTTNIEKKGYAKVTKVEYRFNGEVFATKPDGTTPVTETFTKDGTVTTKIYYTLPGNPGKVLEKVLCSKKITVKKQELEYACKQLIATKIDNRSYRFVVHTTQSDGISVKSANFTLDDKSTVKDVTTKVDGKFYRDYTFDKNSHTVSVVVNFKIDKTGEMVQSKELCKATVPPEESVPECPEKPGRGFPVGDERCHDLPDTGAAGAAGLFAGVTVAGAVAHRWFASRRSR